MKFLTEKEIKESFAEYEIVIEDLKDACRIVVELGDIYKKTNDSSLSQLAGKAPSAGLVLSDKCLELVKKDSLTKDELLVLFSCYRAYEIMTEELAGLAQLRKRLVEVKSPNYKPKNQVLSMEEVDALLNAVELEHKAPIKG